MSDSKKRKKSYYVQGRKTKKQASGYQLDAGMKGFLITCNNAEKKTVQEAYNILSEYAEQMYGCEKVKLLIYFYSFTLQSLKDFVIYFLIFISAV